MASRRWWGLTSMVFGKLGEQFDKSSQDPVAAWLGILSHSGQEDLPGRLDFSVSELRVSELVWDTLEPLPRVHVAATRSSLQFDSVNNAPDWTRTHAHFSRCVSHVTHAQCARLKGEQSPRHHLVFTSISFLNVVAEHSSLFFPTSPILTKRPTIQIFSFSGNLLRARSTPPTSSATGTQRTRRSISPTATTNSSAKTTLP